MALGSFADWAGLIISFSVFFLVYATLKSQIAVQQLQQVLTKIETLRFLNQAKPDFECEVHQSGIRDDYNTTMMYLIPIKNIGTNIRYSFSQFSGKIIDLTGYNGKLTATSIQLGKQIIIQVGWTELTNPGGLICSLNLDYTDDIGTEYQIKFAITVNDVNPEKAGPVTKSYPTLLKGLN